MPKANLAVLWITEDGLEPPHLDHETNKLPITLFRRIMAKPYGKATCSFLLVVPFQNNLRFISYAWRSQLLKLQQMQSNLNLYPIWLGGASQKPSKAIFRIASRTTITWLALLGCTHRPSKFVRKQMLSTVLTILSRCKSILKLSDDNTIVLAMFNAKSQLVFSKKKWRSHKEHIL